MNLVLLQRNQEDESTGILFEIVDLRIFRKQWIIREQ